MKMNNSLEYFHSVIDKWSMHSQLSKNLNANSRILKQLELHAYLTCVQYLYWTLQKTEYIFINSSKGKVLTYVLLQNVKGVYNKGMWGHWVGDLT